MDRINENLYQANIELVDRNKLLEKDVSILQKRIERTIEYIENNIGKSNNHLYFEVLDEEIEDFLNILKGEENGDNR